MIEFLNRLTHFQSLSSFFAGHAIGNGASNSALERDGDRGLLALYDQIGKHFLKRMKGLLGRSIPSIWGCPACIDAASKKTLKYLERFIGLLNGIDLEEIDLGLLPVSNLNTSLTVKETCGINDPLLPSEMSRKGQFLIRLRGLLRKIVDPAISFPALVVH